MVLCFLFLVSIPVTFHLMFVQVIFCSVKVAEWPPVGKIYLFVF